MMPYHTGYEYLLEFFENYDYHKPRVDRDRLLFSHPNNITGHQQRTFNVWWAIKQCWKTDGVGLEIGSGGTHTPWCLSTDYVATDHHPIYNSGCHPHLVVDGSSRLPFEDESFSLVLANHVVEHLGGNVVVCLRDWIRTLRRGGVLGMILPDQQYNDVLAMDKSHRHAWKAFEFRAHVVEALVDVADLIEHDTLQNSFSYNTVLRRK